jgi:preprotein translocase subunit SecG
MLIPIVILTTIVCVLLTLIVLIQNPKGGGLSATFGGFSTSLLGAQRTTDILEKGTWYLAIILIGLSLISEFFVTSSTGTTVETPKYFVPENQGAGGSTQPTTFAPSDWENTVWPFGQPE